MTDIYTVIFTHTWEGAPESIPWILSFADLELAKNHVLEEAKASADIHEAEPAGEWNDYEDYSTYDQPYTPDTHDAWLIIRTELVESEPLEPPSAM